MIDSKTYIKDGQKIWQAGEITSRNRNNKLQE
jgi:hypothetical protein